MNNLLFGKKHSVSLKTKYPPHLLEEVRKDFLFPITAKGVTRIKEIHAYLAHTPDPELEEMLGDAISLAAKHQLKRTGFFNTMQLLLFKHFTIPESQWAKHLAKEHAGSAPKRWASKTACLVHVMSHGQPLCDTKGTLVPALRGSWVEAQNNLAKLGQMQSVQKIPTAPCPDCTKYQHVAGQEALESPDYSREILNTKPIYEKAEELVRKAYFHQEPMQISEMYRKELKQAFIDYLKALPSSMDVWFTLIGERHGNPIVATDIDFWFEDFEVNDESYKDVQQKVRDYYEAI